ncbi:MAG: MBL fold metallo-hydrolase [Deltaproteobacteria bacterium]|nr:MBL fold metallo-hydrolase [Deltaproteobacteria bacterium]
MKETILKETEDNAYEFDVAALTGLSVGPLDVNCYIVWDKATLEGFIIDPGGNSDEIEAEVKTRGLKIKYLLNTHGHFDHVGANSELTKSLNAKVVLHKADTALLESAVDMAAMYGCKVKEAPKAEMMVANGDVLKAGSLELKVIHTPGHTKGGVSYYSEKDGLIFTGDTLFAGGIGRTDFPGGSMEEIVTSIKGRLFTLPESVIVLPGHGPNSTIGDEKSSNPFVQGE